MISESVLPVQDGIWRLETCLGSLCSLDMLQDSELRSKEENWTPKRRTLRNDVSQCLPEKGTNDHNQVLTQNGPATPYS